MEAPLRAAFAGVAEVVPVSFGIDPTWYAIERPRIVEPPNRWVVVSRLTRNKIGPLFEWGQPAFASPERELHLYGPMEVEVELPGWVHYHGPASPRLLADEVFPAARGLITLSQHAEGRPQVLLEAMAASLPTVPPALPPHPTYAPPAQTRLL